jgi:hypothetical protein
LGVGLALQNYAVEFDRLFRVVRIGEAAADHARALGDRQFQFVGLVVNGGRKVRRGS